MAPRFVFHVGPYKTGTTSVQLALQAGRDRLVRDGVLYPESIAGEHPESHAAETRLLANGRERDFRRLLEEVGGRAESLGCDTVFLSSEGFSGQRLRGSLWRAVRWIRRRMRRECRLLYVRRDTAAWAYSLLVQRLHTEAGFLCRHGYDLRRWAERCAAMADASERYFRRLGAVVVPLEQVPRQDLAAHLLWLGTGRRFPDIRTGEANVSADRFGGQVEDLLAYPLRVMEMVAHGGAMSSPRTHEAARAAIASCRLEAPVFDALLRDFEQAARREIAAGVGDFRRSSPLTRAWRRWLPVRGPGPG